MRVFRNVLFVVSKDVEVQFDMYAEIFKKNLLWFVSLFCSLSLSLQPPVSDILGLPTAAAMVPVSQ